METVIRLSRKAYALSIIGIGIQQLVARAIAGNFLPEFSVISAHPVIAYVWSILTILSGVAMLIGWKAYEVALISAGVFLALDVLVQIPFYLATGPYSILEWSAVVQEGGWVGASLIFAGSYSGGAAGIAGGGSTVIRWLARLIPLGGILFSIMFITYGTDHFVYPVLVSGMIPGWIPAHMFWTYFAGAALIIAGIAIIFRIQLQLAAGLLGLMIFIWCLLLHIPNAIRDPAANGGLEVSRAITTFGYTGICLLLSLQFMPRRRGLSDRSRLDVAKEGMPELRS